MASTLVVIEYDDQYKAEEMRLKLRRMQKEYLIDLEDAVVAVKDEKGKIKLHQAVNLTGLGAASGGFWGSPGRPHLSESAAGDGGGGDGRSGFRSPPRCGHRGQLHEGSRRRHAPGSSALFVLVRKSTPERVLEEVKGMGGKILKTSLTHEDEAKLQAALSAAKQ